MDLMRAELGGEVHHTDTPLVYGDVHASRTTMSNDGGTMTTLFAALPGYVNDPVVIALISVVGVGATAWAALRASNLDRRAAQKHEHAQQFAKALTVVMIWKELGYRVARRVDDEPETLAALAAQFNQAQQDLDWHCTWLEIEAPDAATAYRGLVDKVKTTAKPLIAVAPPYDRAPRAGDEGPRSRRPCHLASV
jgi:hypothetical protein